jgi:regulator of replication initiation timing
LEDKDKKIEGLDATIKKLQEAAQYEGANTPTGEDVSQGRLQGMVLRMTATINGKDETIQTQKKQIDDLTEKVEESVSDDAILKVKEELRKIKGQKENLEFELEKERKALHDVVKKKDETIVFFQGELSKFKKQKSLSGHWHNVFNY